jgi:hypothetical protein
MSSRQQRSYIALAIVVLLVVFGQPLARSVIHATAFDKGAPRTAEITPEVRAATLRFSDAVQPGDRAWMLGAIASARPEAQQLIAEIDGLVEIDSTLNVPGIVHVGAEGAIGLAHMSPEGALITVDVRLLDGERAIDRAVVILHELGHVIDYLLITKELRQQLDAGIPTVGSCDPAANEPTGACTAVEERFADTFAKWALGGRVSLAGSGYGVHAPVSIEDWGQPLGLLAAQLSIKARSD